MVRKLVSKWFPLLVFPKCLAEFAALSQDQRVVKSAQRGKQMKRIVIDYWAEELKKAEPVIGYLAEELKREAAKQQQRSGLKTMAAKAGR